MDRTDEDRAQRPRLLTDEELAEIVALGDAALPLSLDDQSCIIAALRASRIEVELLQREADDLANSNRSLSTLARRTKSSPN